MYQIMLPVKVSFGVDSLNTLGEEARKLAAKRVLIVTDPGVYNAGLVNPVKEQLLEAKLKVDVCSEAEPEPSVSKLNAMAEELHKESYDLLIGLGGGSSMDTAKGLSVLLTHGGNAQQYFGINNVPGPGIPVFTLPTTAGTGSEVTQNAIFGDPEQGRKVAIVSSHLIPRTAIVDPTLTYSCPPKVTAACGIDAFVHALECYTGNKANTFSDALALEAMRLIVGNLLTAVRNGSNKEARNRMSEGALLAGINIATSGTAAIHALAYPLGSQFHVPHGVANGLLLPYVTEYNLSANLPKYAKIAEIMGVETQGLSLQEAAERGGKAIKTLVADIGIPLHLRNLGVPNEALEGMAVATMDVTRLLANNPRQLTLDDVRHIWKNAW